jgi:hypothetical protein
MLKNEQIKEDTWDNMCNHLNLDYRQHFFWGEFKKKFGWNVIRIEMKDSKNNKNIFQLLVKKNWPLILCYAPGIKILGSEDLNFIKQYIKEKYKLYFFKYIRIDCCNSEDNKFFFKGNDFSKVKFKKNGNTLLTQILEGNIEEKIKKCRKSWRKDLKKSLSFNVKNVHIEKPNADLIHKLSLDFEKKKKLGKGHNHTEVLYLIKNLKNKLYYLQAENEKKEVIGFKAAIITKDMAWDFFSLTTDEGRECHVGNSLTMDIFQELQIRGVKYYGYLGESERKKPGIFLFKNGTGTLLKDYIGEIEWSNFKIIRIIINTYLALFYSELTPKIIRKKH